MAYATATREDDVIHTIRTVGRLARMLLDLRDEYERRPRPQTVAQIERRLGELIALREAIQARQGAHEGSEA